MFDTAKAVKLNPKPSMCTECVQNAENTCYFFVYTLYPHKIRKNVLL